MKKFLVVITLSVFVIPCFASASWNPFTWFKNSKPSVEGKESIPVINTTPPKTVEPQIIEKVVEKPVIQTKTITVLDPALQAQINALATENVSLKAEVERLRNSNKSLDKELSQCEDKPAPKNKCEEAQDTKEEVSAKISEINAICKEKREQWVSQNGSVFYCPEGSSGPALLEKLRIATADVTLYCN